MSEKRIYCVEVGGDCRYLRVVDSLSLANLFALNEVGNYCSANSWKKITKAQCKNCTKAEYAGITREQAIEKIAKAIYEAMCPNFSQMFVGWRAYTKIAEAALNALLEENNEN